VTEAKDSHRVATSDDIEVATYLEIAEAEQSNQAALARLTPDPRPLTPDPSLLTPESGVWGE
jgi:hypothetical protein